MSSTATAPLAPVAVIGLACRFPGDADSPSKFWDMLKNGRDAYSPTTDRYNADAFYHPDAANRQNVLATKGGHFLKQDPYAFDAAFFNISATEAISFDPKQRIAMEVAFEALENAGKTLKAVSGTQTACYIGSSMSDYRDAVVRDFAQSPKYHILGTCEEMISNRVSHFLNIHGPSATIHTACSSSLVATHLGVQSLRSRESEMALVGGVGMIISPDGNMHLNNLGFLNPEGHSRAFDADASGYGRGEGCGILLLKRLDKAIEDGDTIRAVIRATGVNSDGWTQGVTMPNSDAQAALIKHVYETHGLDYASTQYVEAHGTGTKAGDPKEVGAIYRTIGKATPKSRKLWIGSVKPNIGHLEAAAGVAGIIKGILAMENGMIPPNIHFSRPNPAIPLNEWNMAVPNKLTPWPASQSGRRMSVSGFGMGGTNGHVVLEAFSNQHRKLLELNGSNDGHTNGHSGAQANGHANGHAVKYVGGLTNGLTAGAHSQKRLFVVSSQDQAGFKRVGAKLVEYLDSIGPVASASERFAALAHTLAVARSGLSWRSFLLAETSAELSEGLATRLGEAAARMPDDAPRIGLVFTGQGAQWAKMGMELMDRPVFQKSMQKSADILQDLGSDWTPVQELSRPQEESRLGLPMISQPICTILQIALVDELRAWGVQPARVVGHSSGEIAAAYSLGALTHSQAVAAAYFRGQAASRLTHLKGGMMAVGTGRDEAEELLLRVSPKGTASVACVNSPSSVTLSGDVQALEELRVALEEKQIFARRLKVDVAYHSAHMNVVMAEYMDLIADIQPSESANGQAIMISSVTGAEVDVQMLGSYYWVRNMVSPVLFSDALKEMVQPNDTKAVDLLIEIGPHSALGGPIEQTLARHQIQNVDYLSMLTRGKNSIDCVLGFGSQLFLKGVPIDIQSVNGDSGSRFLTDLPPYPWNHSKSFRADGRLHRELIEQKLPTRSLIGAMLPNMGESQYEWRSFIRLADEPWLRGHTVGTTVLFPGAGIVSIILEAVQQLALPEKTPRAIRMRDVNLFAAIALPEDLATELIIHLRPHLVGTVGSTPSAWFEWTVSTCVGTDQLRDNARGLVAIDYVEGRSDHMVVEDAKIEASHVDNYHRVREECQDLYPKVRFYQHMTKAAWSYGDLFQGVENCRPGYGQTTFDIRLVDIGETFSKGQLERPFLINAASLDAVFQSWLGATYKDGAFEFDKPFLPTSIAELEISLDIPWQADDIMPGVCLAERFGFNELSSDIVLFDEALSRTFLSVKDFRTSELQMDTDTSGSAGAVDPAEIAAAIQWEPSVSLMLPGELERVLVTHKPEQRVVELLRLLLHDNPALAITELVPDEHGRASAATSQLSEREINPSRVRYAVADHDVDKDEIFSQLLSPNDSADLAERKIELYDALVVSHAVQDPQMIEKLSNPGTLSFVKQSGAIIVVAGNPAIAQQLQSRGFQPLSPAADGPSVCVLWRQPAELGEAMSNGHTNKSVNSSIPSGHSLPELVILKPSHESADLDKFAQQLQTTLGTNFSTSIRSWADDISSEDAKGKVLVSLLETERPLLAQLSEPGFEKLRIVVLNSERLLWITRGDDPTLRLVDGFARCMMSENAGIKFQLLHLSGDETWQDSSRLTRRILESKTPDNEFRAVDGILQTARIHASVEQEDSIRYHLEDTTRREALAKQVEPLRLSIGKAGLLDTLRFIPDESLCSGPLKDDEVELEVKASGVNFRDVMACMGVISNQGLGLECSGVVLKAGEKVTEFKPGDRVSSVHVGTHATRIRVDQRGLAKMPIAMSFEEAAAVGVVHMAAVFALRHAAKLSRGQSILIHAAAGGVGQAAVQFAKHLGLVVYVTVGTEDKRQLLMTEYAIPEENIFHSRDASFVKGIHRVTNGRGVDCVLNSLSGELLRASWGCLATFGTFVEMGLRDITNNTRLDMRPFGRSTSFVFINNLTLLRENPDAFYDLFSETFDLIQSSVLKAPSSVTAFPIQDVQEAFRTMQQGKHRGKLVLTLGPEASVPVFRKAKDSLRLDPQATYLFIGGLGGLGRSLAKEFVASGAKHIAFVSRSGGDGQTASKLIQELAGDGVIVRAYRGDVGNSDSFSAAMQQCADQLPPVKGVIQMAMVLRDIVFEKMTWDQWKLPLEPKVAGTWNVHQHFNESRPLDFMVICSSTSGIYGYPSQAQYAAGNTYQDALAHFRRAKGLKAVVVNLGIMRDVGVLAETGMTGNIKVWEEVLGIREPAFHALMKSLINQQVHDPSSCPIQVCTGLGTADLIATHGLAQPSYFAEDARFGPLAVLNTAATDFTASGNRESLASRLGQATSLETATEMIADALVLKTADILSMPASEVDRTRPLYRYGVDSLVALELRNWITRELKASIALLEILAAVPMEQFAEKIARASKLVSTTLSQEGK